MQSFVAHEQFPSGASCECGPDQHLDGVARVVRSTGFERIRLGATLDIRRNGPEWARDTYRPQSAWEDPTLLMLAHRQNSASKVPLVTTFHTELREPGSGEAMKSNEPDA